MMMDPVDQQRVQQEDNRKVWFEERRADLKRNLQPGDVAKIQGITEAGELNGQMCVLTSFVATLGRWTVRIADSSRYVRILADNLSKEECRRWDDGMEGSYTAFGRGQSSTGRW